MRWGSTACSTGSDDGNGRARRLHVIEREHAKPLSRERVLTLCVPTAKATPVMVGERVATRQAKQ